VSKLMIFAGNANPDLAHAISKQLYIPVGNATVGCFSDGETTVEINENVRGHDVFIIQPTCHPTNDNLMELIVMADALRRASALPHYGGYTLLRLRPSGSPSSFQPSCHQRQSGC